MPKIRLNKAIKEFNITASRLANFLKEKGIVVDENNLNAQLDEDAYDILKAEFAKDSEQKKASHEIVITKVPDEISGAKETEISKQKVEKKSENAISESTEITSEKQENTPETSNIEQPTPTKEEDEVKVGGLNILDKIDLDKIDSSTKPRKKEEPKKAENKEKEKQKKQEPKAEKVKKDKQKKQEITKIQPPKLPEEKTEVKFDTPEHVKTQFTKLEGPKIVGEKIDLSQFENKSKPANNSNANKNKRKRKRIEKPNDTQGNNDSAKTENKGNNRPNANKPHIGNDKNKKNNKGKKEKVMPVELTDEQVKNQIKETLEKLTNKNSKSKGSKHRREKRTFRREREEQLQALEAEDKTLKVTEYITAQDLATLMNVSATEVISACFSLGVMVTLNQRLEADTLTLVADEFGYKIEFSDAEIEEEATAEEPDNEENLLPRPPVVTVMGHVDHGKTSLLDYIRKTNVIAGESGGITQHIGAYSVKLEGGQRITFLDTPGHEAFTAMRARGAQATDIVIIVIAADDDVMPQTKEAISHAQAAGVPMIIAINKVDKPNANPDKIREQLSALNILVEEWGGNVQCQEISAKFGNNVDILLEKVLLQAELLELKANPNKNASGVVIEASLDKGRGYVANLLVQGGTLKIGDYLLAGTHHGKIKAMLDERGHKLKEAKPSTPVTVLGLDGAPTAGDKFKIFEDEKEAKSIANKRSQLQREQSIRTKKHLTLDEIGRRIALGDFKELNIILKGDVDGSIEALSDQLQRLSTEEIQVNILHKGVGQITESDILLATASDAIVIGFNVRAGANAKELADREQIDIRTYSVIYAVIDEVKEAMEGMLSPEIKEQVIGNVEIRQVFKISKVGSIAGCMVLSGKVTRNAKVRLLRDGIVKYDGELESLKRFKDDVKEVTKGYECGLNLKGFNDLEENDQLEIYEEVAVKKKLK